MPAPCPHPDSPPRVPILGSRLVLCPACWEAFDPSRPSPTFPEEPMTAAESPGVPLPTPSPPPEPPEPPISDPPARVEVLPPIRRRSYLPVLAVTVVIATLLFVGWIYRVEHPSFSNQVEPDGWYTVEFPVEPTWSKGVSGVHDAIAERNALLGGDIYRIQVITWQKAVPWDGPDNRPMLRLMELVHKEVNADVIKPRWDLGSIVAVDYVFWESARRYEVGRYLAANGYVYKLAVLGSRLSFNDWRVQHFFKSFKLRNSPLPGERG